jgi:hypothetical protein
MRILVIILAVIVMLIGAGCAAAGGVTAAVFGPNGEFNSDDERFGSDTAALVFEADDVSDEEPTGSGLDPSDIEIRISAESTDQDGEIFLGLAKAEGVDDYLSGFEHEVVTDVELDPFELTTVLSGQDGEADPPGDQDFWLESASGTGEQTIRHGLEGGDLRVVIMNTDGSAGFEVDGSIGVKVPYIFWIALGLLGVGLLMVVSAIIAIVLAVKGDNKSNVPGAGPPASQPPSAPPPAAPGPDPGRV